MRRSITAVSALALVAALVVPALAQENQPDPLGAIAEFFQTKAGQEYAAQFTAGGPSSGVTDPNGDYEHSTGDSPGFTPPHIDITQAWSLRFDDGSAGFFGPTDQNTFWNPEGGPLAVDLPSGEMLHTLQGDGGHDGSQFAKGAVLFGMFLADTPPVRPPARCEYVAWLYMGDISGTFQNHPNFPGDPAGGTNLALGMGLNPEGDFPSGMFALVLNDGGGFTYDPMIDLRGIITDRYVGIFAPRDLVEEVHAINFYSFCTSTGGYGSAESGADQTGLIDLTSGDFGQLSFTIAVATTTTTQPTTTSTTLATSGGGGEEPGDSTTEDDGGFNPLLLISLLVVLAGGGYWYFTRTRERTPGGVTSSPPTPQHHQCDWALYFNDGGARVNLRPANGHECCVYDIEVVTDVSTLDVAMKGRQDSDNPQGEDISPDERLRMFDYDGFSAGTNAGAYAATRSGPFGNQNWMHGLGDRRYEAGWKSTDDGEQHIQTKPLEEVVDTGLSIRYEAATKINATLTPGCDDYENTYELDAESDVSMWATSECTNGEPGRECPVELSASGIIDASVSGDLNYDLEIKALTYPDELEPKASNAPYGPVGGVDSHDHATRPRSDWEDSNSESGGNVVKKDATSLKLNSLVHLDSGQIVPMEVWDTTDRVSAEVGGDLAHEAGVSGSMTVGPDDKCEEKGHGPCQCAPDFQLNIEGGEGKLVVDGETYDIAVPWFGSIWHLV